MTQIPKSISLDQPAVYRIEVSGGLDGAWSDYFGGMQVQVHRNESLATHTSLTGLVADQAALHGLLSYIRDLGLPLLRVELLDIDPAE